MQKINEAFLHFLWKNQHLEGITCYSVEGHEVEVVEPGYHNVDAGPDFFNARVKINNTLWAGNVELHINASDWIKHGHENDKAYDTVILHVVYYNDCQVTRTNGEQIPTVVLRFPKLMWSSYADLMKAKRWIPCQEKLKTLSPLLISQWTSSLMVEKLQSKAVTYDKHLKMLNGHWDALLSLILFRVFGLPVNTTPFEMLGLLVPYPLLLRNKKDRFTIEAILFGQAGMLQTVIAKDVYSENLFKEYQRFAGKLPPNHVPNQTWKFLRMRPASFPTIRLAQLSSLIHHHYPLHPFLLHMPEYSKLKSVFRIKAGDYWNTHYQFGKTHDARVKFLGSQFIDLLMINAIVPYLFYYGRRNRLQKYCDYSIHLLESLNQESNAILKNWGKFGITARNAFESQALLFLYRKYCLSKRCLECQFGNTAIIHAKKKE
jgi:hypothetical protein